MKHVGRLANHPPVLFDLDGTLVDNMAFHAAAFDSWSGRRGLPALDQAMRRRIDGKRNRDIFPILLDRDVPIEEVRELSREKESLYRELSRGRLRPVDGLIAFLDALDAARVPFGIATSAPAENVVHTLAELGLTARFPMVARSDEVPQGKPHPDVVLEAARRLGIAATDCVVFEDSPAGLAGARAAGMRCVALSTSFDAATLEAEAAPDLVVRDYVAYVLTLV